MDENLCHLFLGDQSQGVTKVAVHSVVQPTVTDLVGDAVGVLRPARRQQT